MVRKMPKKKKILLQVYNNPIGVHTIKVVFNRVRMDSVSKSRTVANLLFVLKLRLPLLNKCRHPFLLVGSCKKAHKKAPFKLQTMQWGGFSILTDEL